MLKLFLIFVKIGAVLLGGGYVILPILEEEFVKKRAWITNDELVNYFALSQSLPGIVAANISMFIGYKLKGKFGALAAMFGVIFVPFWSIILIAACLGLFFNNSLLQAFFWGVGIAVIALILLTTREIWQKSNRNSLFYTIFLLSLFSLLVLNLSPIQVILIFTCIGICIKRLLRRIEE